MFARGVFYPLEGSEDNNDVGRSPARCGAGIGFVDGVQQEGKASKPKAKAA